MSARIVLGDGPLGDDATVDRDVLVTMRDGARIACDVFRPAAPGKYPVLFAIAPYLKDTVDLPSIGVYRYRETGNIARWVSRGYVYLHADARGSGKSEGQYRPFDLAEQHDLYDMIEWAAVQAWSTGKVGMIGQSYYGMVQWFAAAQNPPHLACIAPYDACNDLYRHFVYKGGILYAGFQNHWYNNSIRNRAYLDYRERPKRDDFLAYDFQLDQIRHPTFDDYWRIRAADLKRITVPVFSIGNWGGVMTHLKGNLLGYELASGPKKLLVNVGEPQKLFQQEIIEAPLSRWYDYWLKGIDNGIMQEPPVRIFVRNGGGYRDEAHWPLARAEVRNLYLAPGPSGAVESLNDGALAWDAPASGTRPTAYTYPDPEWAFPGPGSAVIGKGGLPHVTRKILTFTSAPLDQDIEVTGPIALHLWASSTSTDTQFIASLKDQPALTPARAAAITELDVAPPATLVTMGWLKASHRALDPARSTKLAPYHTHTEPQPLEPNRVYPFAIEIWPTCWVFKAGHRIRLELTAFDGSSFLGHLRATDTFYHDAGRPSHLALPVIA